MSKDFTTMAQQVAATAASATRMLEVASHPVSVNPAQWMHQRLGEYVKGFESQLDDHHEIGARLVSFGATVVFHIEDIGYYGPDIITFRGTNDHGERVQLIQHISQLSVLLVAVKRLHETARRIGYIWDDTPKAAEPSGSP